MLWIGALHIDNYDAGWPLVTLFNSSDTHELLPHAPRTVLTRQVEQAKKEGFGANCASELEYFIYNETYGSVLSSSFNFIMNVIN